MKLNLILAILAVVLLVPCWTTLADERSEDFVDTTSIPMLFPGFSSNLVSLIEITRQLPEEVIKQQNLKPEQAREGVAFQREGDKWVLLNNGPFQGLEMDSVLIERDLLEHITDLRLDRDTLVPEEKVTEEFRRENHLTQETGLVISCRRGPQGPEVARLILGKSTSKGKTGEDAVQGYYVCNPERPREVVIYEPKSRHWIVSLRPSDWAKKRIHDFLVSEVASFSFTNGQGGAGFKREGGAGRKWVAIPELCKQGSSDLDLSKLGAIKQEDVTEFLDKFKSIDAELFVRKKSSTDMAGNEAVIRATLKDSTEFVLYLEPSREERLRATCLATSSNHDFQFELADFTANAFKRQDPRDFFDPQ